MGYIHVEKNMEIDHCDKGNHIGKILVYVEDPQKLMMFTSDFSI